MKEILISVDEFEKRVAVLEDDKLAEYYIDREPKQIGSIYKGRVVNILPGIQAAFIDIGLDKNAFLCIDDLVLKNNIDTEDFEPIKTPPSIKDLLKVKQETLVQVVKESVKNKGSRVTTQITLPGRYVVLIPQADYIGISRRIEDLEEKERLKEIADKIKSHKMGLIIRTAAYRKSLVDIKRDLRFLIKLWKNIESTSKRKKSPALIYQEIPLIFKVIRDTFTNDIDRLIINSTSEYKEILKFLNIISPALKKKVHLFKETQKTLFEFYGVDTKLEKALQKRVWLPSGGYIYIEGTEALTVIDVNSGKYTGKKSLAETILKINLEAALEIARLIRLRDIGGIIIIDFIDMETEADRFKLLGKLSEYLKKDRTKTSLIGMSELGLVQITRKRLGRNLSEFLNQTCPYCKGTSKVTSIESMYINFNRLLKKTILKHKTENILAKVCPELAVLVLGWQAENLKQLERQIRKSIYLQADPGLHQEKIELKAVSAKQLQRIKFLSPQEVISLKVIDIFGDNVQNGLGTYHNNIVEIHRAGDLVGKEVTVIITDVYRSYAQGKMIE